MQAKAAMWGRSSVAPCREFPADSNLAPNPRSTHRLHMNLVSAALALLLIATDTHGAEVPVDPSDDFSPMLALMALLAVLVMLIVLGICLAIAAITAVCLLVLIALGILSTSALTGLLRRKFSSGLRALHYQACAAIALPVGAALAWLAIWLFDTTAHLPTALAIGAFSGICAGLAIAYILDRAATAASLNFEKRKTSSHRIHPR